MEQTFFKLKINIPNLDSYMGNNVDPCTFTYLSELIVNHKEEKVSIKIFYPEREYLAYKLKAFNHNRENNLLKQFEVVETLSPDELGGIDFTGFKSYGITDGSNDLVKFKSDGPEFKFTVVSVTGVRIKFKDLADGPSQFYLNSVGFLLVEMNYKYSSKLPWEDKAYTWEPKNQIEEYIKFDKIEFIPDHHFYSVTTYNASTVSIQKEPRLLVKHAGLAEAEIRKQVLMVCALLSFYANEDVDYFVSKTNATDGRFFERRKERKIDSDGHGIFMWDFSRNPLNLIISVNAEHLMAHYDFVTNLIKRFNYAMQLSGEAKFMILYNVLEQLRVQYITEGKIDLDKSGKPSNPKKVIQEYQFIKDEKDTKAAIKEALEGISNIIKPDQQADFNQEISTKIKNIKLMTMANQFKSLFDHTTIDPSICNLDFDKIKTIRNEIFHGAPVPDDLTDYLEKISNYDRFPRFVGIMILKYFGIDNLMGVVKKYN